MCCCFQTFKELFGVFSASRFKRAAKLQPFYISTKFSWYFSKLFTSFLNPDYLKNYLKN